MNTLKELLVPQPLSVIETNQPPLLLKDGVRIHLPGAMADWARKRAREFWHIAPVLIEEDYTPGKPESYKLTVSSEEITIQSPDAAGVRYAFYTLRQLAEPQRLVASSPYWQVQTARIEDEPSMAFRGILLVHYAESFPWELERNIRLAAYYKFNYVVLEFRGTFPFEKHPELCFEDYHADRTELKRILSLARDLGVTPIPLYNLLGHATGVGIDLGKHVILDRHPELGPLFEPDGWSLCLSNPHIRPIMADALTEMHDFFGNPPFFHAGSDEPFNLGTCSICRKANIPQLYKDYLNYLHEIAEKRNCRLILWHDAFFDRQSKEYDGYIVDDREGPDFSSILPGLPKDIIFDFWQYDYPEINGAAPIWKPADCFQNLGFDVLMSPWDNEDGIRSMAEKVKKQNLKGMLQTTWFACRGTIRQKKLFLTSINNMWNPAPHAGKLGDEAVLLGGHVRQIDQDMGLTDYRSTGSRDFLPFA